MLVIWATISWLRVWLQTWTGHCTSCLSQCSFPLRPLLQCFFLARNQKCTQQHEQHGRNQRHQEERSSNSILHPHPLVIRISAVNPQCTRAPSILPCAVPAWVPLAPVLYSFHVISALSDFGGKSISPLVLLFLLVFLCLIFSTDMSSRSAAAQLWGAEAAIPAKAISGVVEHQVILLAVVLTVRLGEGVVLPQLWALFPYGNTEAADEELSVVSTVFTLSCVKWLMHWY